MPNKNIELELRAEVMERDVQEFLDSLRESYNMKSHTLRLSVMFFGEVDEKNFDIRVRITDGDAEVVIKKGNFHADDRTEVEQSIQKSQFVGFVRLFSLFDFDAEVAKRETYNFSVNENVTLSLVMAGDIAYVEIEKMTNNANIEGDRAQLYEIMEKLNLDIIEQKEVFDMLCDRLSEKYDWTFSGSQQDFSRLKQQLDEHDG